MREIFIQHGITCLYHFTDIRNLPYIIEEKGLLSFEFLEERGLLDKIKCGGNPLSQELNGWSQTRDKIKLYPRYKTPMAYILEQRDWERSLHLCYLEINLDVALEEGVVFTDINSTDSAHKEAKGMKGISLLDFRWIKDLDAWQDPTGKKKSQAEIMVPDYIDLSKIERIYFISEASLEEAKRLCPSLETTSIELRVEPTYFYRSFYTIKSKLTDEAKEKMFERNFKFNEIRMKTEFILPITHGLTLINDIRIIPTGTKFSFKWCTSGNEVLQETKGNLSGSIHMYKLDNLPPRKIEVGDYFVEFYLNDIYQLRIPFQVR